MNNTTRRKPQAHTPRLALTIQCAPTIRQLPFARTQIRRWVQSALQESATLTVRFVGQREGRALNAAYRQRDYATNVLTFSYHTPGAACQGDIVICLPVVRTEAQAQHKTLRDHLAHLLIHGTLHAQGWDHEEPAAAHAMETLETSLLKRFRIADPYADG